VALLATVALGVVGARIALSVLAGESDEVRAVRTLGGTTADELAALEPLGWPRWADPVEPGTPWATPAQGLLTFRGNPSRTFHGTGPVPDSAPAARWRYPATGDGMCSTSTDLGATRVWCGMGWTGQPAVTVRGGRTWVIFGAYDGAVHFVDGDTGEAIIPPFPTGDLAKGSVSIDPDGHPIVYAGSRDNFLRAIAFDGPAPRELWRFHARDLSPTLWNDDWDSNALVIDDYLFEGGENSWWFIWKLNRGYDPTGRVTVAPELVFSAPGWDDELLADVGDEDVSIETSLAVSGDTVYFANSGGLVQGWDISGLDDGADPTRVFRFWTGDDTDATIVVDDEGFLYVASEVERFTEQSLAVGQIMKLDPRRPDDPVVWSVPDPDRRGVWATPAIHRDLLIVPTDGGRVKGIDRATGAVRWELRLRGPTWQSPVVVDDVLVQGDCRGGMLRGFDVSDTTVAPPQIWSVELGGCIESTPAVWQGRIYVGTRGGFLWSVGDVQLPDGALPVVVAPGGD